MISSLLRVWKRGEVTPEGNQKPVVKPGLVVPGLRCPYCRRGAVEWIDGGSWILRKDGISKPHYLCYHCLTLFHIRQMKNSNPFRLYRLP